MPNNKVSETQALYVNEIRQVQKSPEIWKNFLDFSAQARISEQQNEYEFSTKLIIHAKNPKATDCRTFGEWKTQDGNHVNRFAKGITVLSRDTNGNQSITYLFDTSQTAFHKEPERIVIPEEQKDSFKSALSSMIDRLSDNVSFSDKQKRLFRETAEYKLCKQYGLETNESSDRFSGIENLSVKEVANIGIALNRCSQEISAIIERNDFSEQERAYNSKSGEDRTELHGRERRGVDLGRGVSGTRHEVPVRRESERMEQTQRGEHDLRAVGMGSSAEADSRNGQVRQHETEIHMANSMPDRSDNAERGTGSRGGEINSALRGNERESSEPDRRNNGEEKAVGGIQGNDEIGQISSDSTVTGEVQSGSGGRNTSRDSLRNITNETAEPEKVSAVSDLSVPPEIDTQPEISVESKQAAINSDILRGNDVQGGKQRIEAFYSEQNPNRKDFADFLKKEYGIGGHSGNEIIKFQSHDSEGLSYDFSDGTGIRLSWSEVADKISDLIDKNEYLTANEITPNDRDEQSNEQSDTFDNAKRSKNGDIIIGNTTFRYIPEKTYTKIDKDIAADVAEQLEKQGVKFSGVIKDDTATITVSKPQKETLDRIIADISSPDNDIAQTAEEQSLAAPELTYREKAFLNGEIAPFMAKSVLAWDEIEDIGYILFEDGYIDRHKPNEKAIFGNGLHEPKLYDMAKRMHSGEDIRKELTLSLFGNQNTFVTTQDNKFNVEYNDDFITAKYGNAERQVSYEDLGNAFFSLIENEYNDIVRDRTIEDLQYNIPKLPAETAQQLIEAFDKAARPDWENNLQKQRQIKRALYDVLDNDEYTQKAFDSIADMKYNVKISSIGFFSLGNGVTVCDTSRMDKETNDYVKVAHISPEGVLKMYDDSVSEQDMVRIRQQVNTVRDDFVRNWNLMSKAQQFETLLDRADITTQVNILKDSIPMEEKIEKYMPFVFFKKGERPEPQTERKINEKSAPTVDDLSVGDIILYDGKRREVEQIDEKRISLKDLDSPNFGGILLGTSDVYAYAGWQEDMNSKGFEILSKAEKTSEITRDMYQTENPDVLVIKGKGSLAKIDISVSDELWDRLAEKGLVRNENSVDRLLYETDNINWNKLVIPDKWGNMTNNINIEDVLTREELLTAKSVADFVIKPENSIEAVETIETAELSNEIVWSPILETADDNGRPTSYSTKYNDKFYWITENADGGYDIETDFGHGILTVGEQYSNFPTRYLAEEAFEDYIADVLSAEHETDITEPQNEPFSEEISGNNETIKYRITKNTDEQYKFNVQILTRSENGEFTYSGNGRFCETLDEAHAFIKHDIAERNAKSPKEHFEKNEISENYIEDMERSFLSEKQALISVEIFGEEHYFKISDSSVDDILKTANTEKPLLEFMEMGEKISGEEYAEIQQSDSFTYSVELNLDNDTASVYKVNNGKGGISESDRTDSNVTFETVKISDYSDKAIEERIATDNLPETKFTSISDEARMYLDFHQYVPSPEVTPWGETQSCYEINKGIFDVTTAGHGGIMIRSDIADKILSPEARKIGFREKGFHCFEEDCDIVVAYRELTDKKLFRDMNNFFEEWYGSTYEEKFEQFSNTTDECIKRWFPDYWDKREQAIFNARPEEEQAAITGQLSLFGEISDIEDFPDFTEEENISDNAVNVPVEKSDSSQNEKNTPANDSAEVSAENHDKEPSAKKSYFRITDEHLGEGSKREKFQNNIEAIKALQIIESEERSATPEEQETLSKYIGWGGLQEAFDERESSWSKEYNELKILLSEEEYEAARSTVNDAFYTSPVITQAIYEGLANIGFEGGEILEPSMGVGNFFGTMPDKIRENSNLAGIEIDSISGRIAQKLYPEANIAINGYEKIKLEKGSFDLAVGNVPFGNHGVNDKTKAYSGLLIHDYFFAKSLDSVRSGGIVAFVTSTGTLDKEDIKVRQMLAQKAELMGAVRLPNNAFQKNAGTQTATDIIFLKKREKPLNISDMPMDKSCDWVHTKENADGLKINSYFADNPDMVLGKLSDNGRFGSIVCHPIQGADLKEQLHEAMKNIKGEYVPLEFQQELDERAQDNYLTATPDIENLTYTVVDNKLYYRVDDSLIPLKESEQHGIVADRRKAMCGLGETVRELLQAQVEDRPDKEIKLLQAELNVKYDNFVKKFGRINPIETPNSRNASGVSRKAPNSNVFKNDVRLPLLQSLEKMQDGQFIGKTEIFTERTIRPHKVAEHVETAHEALILSMSEKGRIDFDYMEKLTGFEKNKLIDDLHGDIYPVPELSTEDNTVYQTSDEYLSGNIYKKIAQAEAKMSENPAYAENIAALTEVIPKPLKATEIDMQLGMTWIDTKIIQQFMYETFETPTRFKEYDSNVAQENPNAITVQYSGSGKGSWKIENARLDNSVKSTKNFGTKDYNAYELLEKILNSKSVAVTETVKDPDTGSKKTVILEKQTKAAEDKVKQINAAFKKWVFADPERRNELVKTYNEKFNGIRPREYDGSNLNFFGSNPEITLKPHQKNAVAHALFGGNTLFAHQVGAGKTFEMIATAMEGKRLGLHNKSMFVVPNHLTEQIGSDFMKLYPNANILVAKSDDFSPQKRRQMCARIATGNFDAVIIGHSQLIKIPLSPKREEEFIRKQIDEVVSALEAAEETDSKSYTVKQLEATRKNLRDRLEKLTNGTVKDNAVTFEELGVDKLFVDEAHEFKNLYVSTKMENVSGLSTNADVQKTQDLYMKCQYLDEKTDSKGIVFSTGTPIPTP